MAKAKKRSGKMPRSTKSKYPPCTVVVPPDVSYAVHKAGIKIYPVSVRDANGKVKWYVEAETSGILKRFDKEVSPDELPDAICKTILYYHKKLTDPNLGKPQ